MPAAVVWVLRAQVAVVYVMAGLAKLNHDWLVRGEPMATWLASRTDLPVVGPLLDEPWAGRAASWAGVAVRPDDRRLAAVAAHAGRSPTSPWSSSTSSRGGCSPSACSRG